LEHQYKISNIPVADCANYNEVTDAIKQLFAPYAKKYHHLRMKKNRKHQSHVLEKKEVEVDFNRMVRDRAKDNNIVFGGYATKKGDGHMYYEGKALYCWLPRRLN
jgi:hypothetical protein